MGKGAPAAPVLPLSRWRSVALPTPMATDQRELPVAAIVYDKEGREVAHRRLGRLQRRDSIALDAEELLATRRWARRARTGHMELVYDLSSGGDADGRSCTGCSATRRRRMATPPRPASARISSIP